MNDVFEKTFETVNNRVSPVRSAVLSLVKNYPLQTLTGAVLVGFTFGALFRAKMAKD